MRGITRLRVVGEMEKTACPAVVKLAPWGRIRVVARGQKLNSGKLHQIVARCNRQCQTRHTAIDLAILLQILATSAMAAQAIQNTIDSAHANLLHWLRLVGMPLRLDPRPARIDKHARTSDTIVSTRHHTSTTENEACIHACNAQYRCYGPTRNCKTVRYRCFKLFEISGLRGRVRFHCGCHPCVTLL